MQNAVTVTVQYVGKDDFTDEFPHDAALQSVKVRAMNAFGLDPSASDEYVLQLNGADLADHSHLGDANGDVVILRLVLKDDVPKG